MGTIRQSGLITLLTARRLYPKRFAAPLTSLGAGV